MRAIQQKIKKFHLQLAIDQPCAKPAQNRLVKARIVQIQTKRILAIDAPAHGVRCLPVREAFHKLQYGDQRKPAWRFPRLTSASKQTGELHVIVHTTQHLTNANAGAAFRKCRLRYAPRFFRNTECRLGFK